MSKREAYEFSSTNNDGAKQFWKSLEQKANPEAFDESRITEAGVKAMADREVSRRGMLTLGAMISALVAEGCARRPVEKILPYTKANEQILPGVANHYATVRSHRGEAIGLLIESHEGHPTKIEGNPDHPASLGASDGITQASIFDLYDPDRARKPKRSMKTGTPVDATYTEIDSLLADVSRQHMTDQGIRLRILMEPTTSPTMMRLREQVLSRYRQAKIYTYASVNESNAREGARIAFGQAVNVVPELTKAQVVVAIDSDFLGTEAGNIRAMRGFAASRRVMSTKDEMSRLYVVEPSVTVTGMNADHRLRVQAADAERYLKALARELSQKHGVDLGALAASIGEVPKAGFPDAWIASVAKDLAGRRRSALVLVGSRQPPRVHALAHAINHGLGCVGTTVNYFAPADATERDAVADIKALAAEMESGKVGTLLILGGNPVYDAPSDLKFGDKLRTVDKSIHLSAHLDETSMASAWHIPLAHDLESWGDERSRDGTTAIKQPLIAPLHGARSAIEVLAKLTTESNVTGYELVKTTRRRGTLDGDKTWNDSVRLGVVQATVAPAFGAINPRHSEIAAALTAAPPVAKGELEVTFAPCPKLFDGRYANNMWLQELPDPVSKITWDNVAYVSPTTAKQLGLESQQMVRLERANARPIEVAVWVLPGQADNSIALTLGWGRQITGRYGKKHGFDVQPLRTSDGFYFAGGVKLTKLDGKDLDVIKERFARPGLASGPSPAPGRTQPDDPFEVETYKYKISQTQDHDNMEGRAIAIDADLDEYKKTPTFVQYKNEKRGRKSGSPDPRVLPLWSKRDYSQGHKWGMVIDLNACTGCASCMIACQSENNVPSVGKEQVQRGREMYWLRIDRYFSGSETDPQMTMQPVACVQCEEAPCENVCPVNATAHSPEGLNDMAYNRCIGTRYCANNCPYKVRRFNYLNYNGDDGVVPDTEQMHFNPDVTVRMRGVMEKCTYCVQRIQEAKIGAKVDRRELKDGEIVTACAQACPAQAIVFGDLNDPKSQVGQLAMHERGYRLLAELGTGPRTTYLGKLRNPNPEIV